MAAFRQSPSLLTSSTFRSSISILHNTQRRTFIPGLPNLPNIPIFSPVQHITATRTLPYPTLPIFQTIARVPLYATFLPYCLSSTVTRWSNPDEQFRQRWPEEAVLEIGWGAVRERFTSKIYCVPGKIVEAVAGQAQTGVSEDQIRHHTHSINESVRSSEGDSEILTRLMTRWEVQPLPATKGQEKSSVTLNIEYQFANPVYAAMSQVAAGAVADKMIEAFENRIREEMTANSAGRKEAELVDQQRTRTSSA